MSMVVRAMVSVVGEACSDAISLSAGRIQGSHARPYIRHEGAIDCLDTGGALFVKRLGFGFWGGDLWFA